MPERREDASCQICQNCCAVTMTVDTVGIVTAAWRNIPVHNGIEQKPCPQLGETIGKNIGKALRWISSPALGTYLAGGH